jgi:LysR family transcriptional regulator, glycine cleavage system transcriptional activator
MKKFATLPHLPAFEAAARNSSFRVAADELFITTGAVSRHIKSLEDQLNTKLFYRSHKSVRLTEAGEVFSRFATRMLNELAEAEMKIGTAPLSGRLTVQCLPTFAMHWLMPRLSSFNELHPELTVDVVTSTGSLNKITGFDIAIRRDPAHFGGIDPIPLLKESSILVCSKDYLSQKSIDSPLKLQNHVKIEIRARKDLWKSWYNHFPADLDNGAQSLTLDHTFGAIQAAEDGLGITVIPYLFCAKHIETGRLISPFNEHPIETGEYSLLVGDRKDEKVEKFVGWISAFS